MRGQAAVSVFLDGWHALLYLQAFCEGEPLRACRLIWRELIQLAKACRSWLCKLMWCSLQGSYKGCARRRR